MSIEQFAEFVGKNQYDDATDIYNKFPKEIEEIALKMITKRRYKNHRPYLIDLLNPCFLIDKSARAFWHNLQIGLRDDTKGQLHSVTIPG